MSSLPEMNGSKVVPVLRYPGGKQRLLAFLSRILPRRETIEGRYVEPFVGGASVFLHVRPRNAVLSDSNAELIDLYRAIKRDARGVWERYRVFGNTKRDYYSARGLDPTKLRQTDRAARLLYLNRTCFKGNWRHNSKGQFNIGYGGQSRRWVIGLEYLKAVSSALRSASIRHSDFEPALEDCQAGDFVFLDPPYLPGHRELVHDHYAWQRFTFEDHRRLAVSLRECASRGVRWCLTTSSHPDVLGLFRGFDVHDIPPRGQSQSRSGEIVILSKGGGA